MLEVAVLPEPRGLKYSKAKQLVRHDGMNESVSGGLQRAYGHQWTVNCTYILKAVGRLLLKFFNHRSSL